MEKHRIDRATMRSRAHHNRREIMFAVVLTVFAVAIMAGLIAWPRA